MFLIMILLWVIPIFVVLRLVFHCLRLMLGQVMETEVEVVNEFPSYPFQLLHMRSSPPQECIICRKRFQPQHQFIILPGCGHIYHSRCIRTWLANNQSCPLCRRVVANNDHQDDSSTTDTSPEGYIINSTVATDGSSPSDLLVPVQLENESDDQMASSSSSSSELDSFEIVLPERTDSTEPPKAVVTGVPGEDGAVLDHYELDDVEQNYCCFSYCFGLIGRNKPGAPRGSGSAESHLAGVDPALLRCFSRCPRVFKPNIFGAPEKVDGGSAQQGGIAAGLIGCCSCFFNFVKPKKS